MPPLPRRSTHSCFVWHIRIRGRLVAVCLEAAWAAVALLVRIPKSTTAGLCRQHSKALGALVPFWCSSDVSSQAYPTVFAVNHMAAACCQEWCAQNAPSRHVAGSGCRCRALLIPDSAFATHCADSVSESPTPQVTAQAPYVFCTQTFIHTSGLN